MAINKKYDVIIVGGGLAGLSLSCRLGAGGVCVLCLDREPAAVRLDAGFDGRTTAISAGSATILDKAGLWDHLQPRGCAINGIDILDGDSPTLLNFDKTEVAGAPFGWIIENQFLRRVMLGHVRNLKNVTHLSPANVVDFRRDDASISAILDDGSEFSAPLLIGADGKSSLVREWAGIGTRNWSYRQRALVCVVNHEGPHDNVAVEHFRASGPFAVLPMLDDANGNHCSSIVWTEHGSVKNSAVHYDPSTFDAALTARFPARYGAVRQAGPRYTYPLNFAHAHNYIAPRLALVAEAAHAIHPIAGQGLNLGLRDIDVLTDLLIAAHTRGEDFGDTKLLETYQRGRRPDNTKMAAATDTLNRLFANDIGSMRNLRRLGLRTVSRLSPAKQFFMRQAMGKN